jgi:predicted acylesterase/phospholipase RssA
MNNENIKYKNYDTLVLCGGAVKGIIILGSLQYILENGYFKNINTIIGTSIGAVIGYLLTIGYTPIDIHVYICTHKNLFENLEKINFINLINGLGAISYSYVNTILEKLTIDKLGKLITLKELKDEFNKKLIAVTFNETLNKIEYISYETHPNIKCLDALRMSINIPEFFEQFIYEGNNYIDGGICDNFAIEEAEKNGNKVLGIILYKHITPCKNENFISRLYRRINIPYYYSIEHKIFKSNEKSTIIKLDFENNILEINVDNVNKSNMFSNGYKETKTYFENSKENIVVSDE